MPAQTNISGIWDRVVDQVKMKVIRPTLWRSLEIAVPIAIEDGQFVVGFVPGSFHMSGNLTSADHKNAIEKAILEFSGQSLRLRIIEGDSIDDWTQVKYKDQHVHRLREEASRQAAIEASASQSWDTILEQISRQYAAVQLRQLPQNRARYVTEILKSLCETIDELMPAGSEPDELAERALARAIEKIAQLADMPSTVVAFELNRMRGLQA